MDEMGRRVLGTRVLTGLKRAMLNAWNYVVNIPGRFFFDGWPLNLTVTTDPNKNTFRFDLLQEMEQRIHRSTTT